MPARPGVGPPTSQPTAALGKGKPLPMPDASPVNLPPGHPTLPGSGPGSVKGTLRIAPELAKDVKAGSVVFIMLRRPAAADGKGMLLAVKKHPVTGPDMFPLHYELTQANIMMQGMKLEGEVVLSARIDQDRDALSKTPGDITGVRGQTDRVGATRVDLTLTKKL